MPSSVRSTPPAEPVALRDGVSTTLFRKKYLTVDIGGSHATCAVVEFDRVRARRRIAIPPGSGLRQVLPLIAESSRELMRECECQLGDFTGIALAFCGLVDPVRRRIVSTNAKYDDAVSIDLSEWAQSSFGFGLRIENDARMALLGERLAGAARNFDDVVTITLGTGVGGAAMMNSRLVRGRHYQAGCLGGHLLARVDGRPCTCGNIGCVEAEASTWALPEICRRHPGFEQSLLSRQPVLDFGALFNCAETGDSCAQQVLDDCVRVWSAGIVSLVHAYDPELVVVGGGVMQSASLLLPKFISYVHEHAWTPWGKVEIRAALLGDDASLLGAAPLWEDPAL